MVNKETLLVKGLSQVAEMHQTLLGKVGDFLEGVKSLQAEAGRIRSLPKGDRGDKGDRGPQGIAGKDGRDGRDGQDGLSPDKEEIALMAARMIARPKDGKDGEVPTLEQIVSSVITELQKDDKLGIEKNLSGFRGEIASYRNQLAGKVYGKDTWARGGGDTVSAGNNITLTKLPNGTVQISSSGGGGNIVYNEVVAGSGTSWTLANTPINNSLQLFANGQRLTPTVDYSITGSAITTVLPWAAGTLLADYQY